MIDINNNFLGLLLSRSTLATAVENRIFALALPHKTQFPAIVFQRDGGDESLPFLDVNFEILIYAETDIQADLIDGFLTDALSKKENNDLSLYNINWIENNVMGHEILSADDDNKKIRQSFFTVQFIDN